MEALDHRRLTLPRAGAARNLHARRGRRSHRPRRRALSLTVLVLVALVGALLGQGGSTAGARGGVPSSDMSPAAVVSGPNIFFYNLDDLRDSFPGGIDPLTYMPKTAAWMSDGRRFSQTFIADPSCCPSRAAMMTGRYPHNNGVRDQQDGPAFDGPHSMACYLRGLGYRTHIAGKFLVSWPKSQLPPCFTQSTVMWGGYRDVQVKVDGVSQTAPGYSTTYLGNRGRDYIRASVRDGASFLLYETPQAPHWVNITNPDGTVSKLARPDTQYASAPVGQCAGAPEADRRDKPAYVRKMNYTTSQAQAMCTSQMRAVMSADDQFAATMQVLSDLGVLANTLVILSSDNGYMWGEHGRWEKFVPYEPSVQVPLLLRWPGHVASGTEGSRLVSSVDILPTILEAAGWTRPAGAPPLDGESLLQPSQRTRIYSEYYRDGANPNIPPWRMIRTRTAKLVHTYDDSGAIIAREYYDLVADPAEHTNLLGDGVSSNDPPASTISALTAGLNSFATCSGSGCVQ